MRPLVLTAACFALTVLVVAPASAATYDLTGSWTFVTANGQGSGPCPAPVDQTGTATIVQDGDTFTVVLSGVVCDPVAVCSFAGTVAGTKYTGSNSVIADDEGGRVVSTLVFDAESSIKATGSYSAVYSLADFSCSWSYDFQYTRPGAAVDLGGGFRLDSAVPEDAGPATDAGTTTKKDDGGCAVSGTPASGLFSLLLVALWTIRRRRR